MDNLAPIYKDYDNYKKITTYPLKQIGNYVKTFNKFYSNLLKNGKTNSDM